MKILVTGGAGYIASHTNLELLNAGYEVVVVDNLSNSCLEAIKRVERLTGRQVKFYKTDLLNQKELYAIFEKETPDAVIHFAGLKAVGESCKIPLRYFENNITGTLNLLNCMEKYNVKKLVFSSSATVYGQPDKVPITEDFPLKVMNPYGRTKLMIEDMLRDIYAADNDWDIVILRYFNPIGAHESGEIGEAPNGIPNNLVPYVAKVAVGTLPKVNVYGNDYNTPDGTGIRDYIHVVDLSMGHIKSIEKLNTHPGIVTYNLGTGVGYSVLEIIKNYEKACGRKIPYEIAPRRPGDGPICYADSTKALRELSWRAERGVEKMCEDSYRWQSKNPNGYEEVQESTSVAVDTNEVDNPLQQVSVSWESKYPWYNRAVFYHIYPLGMCGAPKENRGVNENIPFTHEFTPAPSESRVVVPANRMNELIQFIPHMQRLSISGLYIGPLFESTGHGYETTDYYKVDSRLGDNASFVNFVKNCHAAGINVVVDGVFNHTGRDFFAFRDLRKKRENSEYKNWYCNVNFSGNNEFNDGFSYEAWHGYNILPRLNLKNPVVKNYLMDVIRFWVSEFDIDGIRLDTADVLDFEFMKELRVLSREIKPDFWLMGEVIHGDYSRWVNKDMLHSVTDYELHKGLYSSHNDFNYFEIAHTVKRLFGNGGIVKNEWLYTFVENQDVDRLPDKLKIMQHIKPIYILIFTLPGIPTIYYGGEFAIKGKHENGSDDGIRPELHIKDYYLEGKYNPVDLAIFAGEVYQNQYSELAETIEWLGRLHNQYESLVGGEYQELLLTNRQYAFARVLPEEAMIVVVNNDVNSSQMTIKLPFGEKVLDTITRKEIIAKDGLLKISISGCDGCIYLCSK